MRANKILTKISALLLVFILALSLFSCQKPQNTELLWQGAAYTEDTTLGEGAKTVFITVTAGEKSILFTIKTDADILGEALLAHGLVEGENGPYGLYVKRVNGILADFDMGGAYWGLRLNGKDTMYGVDGAAISGEEHYELIYKK